jgi:hypothetical protein
VIYPAGAQNYSLVVSDLNLDGKKDLAVFGSGNNVSILLGKGDGTFQAAVTKSLGSALGNVSVGDFNGDNKPDLVFPGFPNSLLFLQGNGDGTFADAVSYPAATDALKATVGDFNGDGKLDVAVANNAAYTILLGNGNGTFQNAVTHTLSSNTSNIANGDFDGDGKLDLAVANYFGGISFLAGNGDGTFAPAVGYPSGSYSIALVGTDFNNDGRLDVAVTNGGGTVVGVLLNTALTHVPLTEFSASGYAVNEEAFYADITVSRSGNSSGAIAVDYSTGDGTAKQSADYTNAFGTLNFAPGETSKTFTILVADNNYVDGNRTVLLNLSNPVGALINGSTSAVLTIADNDTIQPTTNPADDPQFFVRQHYSDFLNRVPDSGGFNFWTGFVTQCVNDPVCVRSRRIDVSNAFFYELEYQQTGAYVYRLYRAAFGNNQPFPNPFPDTNNPGEEKKVVAYQAFVQDRARVVGGANLAQAQLELANAFVLRTAFQSKYSVSLDGPGFVDAVLATIKNELGADLAAQRSALIALYNSGGRGAVMYRLADDNAQTNPVNNQLFINAEYNRAFVATQYFGYLRRDPDMGGFLFWLGQVSSAPLRDVTKQHAMVCSFVTSGEYQLRFSSVVTHSNSECQ